MGNEEGALCFNFSGSERGVRHGDSGESMKAIVFDLKGEE